MIQSLEVIYLRKSVSRIDDGNELPIWCLRYNRVDLNWLTVRTNDPIHICVHLPMLITIRQAWYRDNAELRRARDILEARHRLADCELSSRRAQRIVLPIEKERNIVRAGLVELEYPVEDGVTLGAILVKFIPDERAGVWPKSDEALVALGGNVRREGGSILDKH